MVNGQRRYMMGLTCMEGAKAIHGGLTCMDRHRAHIHLQNTHLQTDVVHTHSTHIPMIKIHMIQIYITHTHTHTHTHTQIKFSNTLSSLSHTTGTCRIYTYTIHTHQTHRTHTQTIHTCIHVHMRNVISLPAFGSESHLRGKDAQLSKDTYYSVKRALVQLTLSSHPPFASSPTTSIYLTG